MKKEYEHKCKRKSHVLVGLLLLTYVGLYVNASWTNTPVWHEPSQLLAGLNVWKFGRFDTQTVNPPLVRSVTTLPLLALTPVHDESKFDLPTIGRFEFTEATKWISDNPDRSRTFFFVARLTCLVFPVLGILFCYRFANEIYGASSAILSLLLICFSPFFLGNAPTIMNDVPTAFLAVISVYNFWKWLKRPEFLEAVIAGIMLGLAVLCKFTLLIFYPLFPALWLFYRIPEFRTRKLKGLLPEFGLLCLLFIVSVFIVNSGYLFEGTFTRLNEYHFKSMALTGNPSLDKHFESTNRFAGSFLGQIPVPLPSDMIQGIDLQKLDFERGFPSYLRGEWSDHGWWYYYFYALLIKTPLGTIGLFLLAGVCTFCIRKTNATWRDEMVVFVPGIVILFFVSSQDGFSVHSRYVIPALPFLLIWTSKLGKLFTAKHRILATVTTILLVWSIGSSLWVYPHSLSYFNELAGGPRNGPKYLLDSNIDWGQDLFYLEKWCRNHPEVKEIHVAYWGSFPLEQTTIPDKGMPPATVSQPGWYALSVNYLYGREKQYQYFLEFEPVAMAGYSIYIYHFTGEEREKNRYFKPDEMDQM